MATEPTHTTDHGLTVDRLAALTDGVLAILVTLLVLGLTEEHKWIVAGKTEQEIWWRLLQTWPELAALVVSFVQIAIYWIIHHIMFHYIYRTDRVFVWLNLLFLLGLSVIPFPTDLIAETLRDLPPAIVVFYGVNHVATGLLLCGMWCYATARHLVPRHMDRSVMRAMTVTALLGPTCYGVGIVLAFVDVRIAVAVYLVVPLFYVVPGRVDHHWGSLGHRTVPGAGGHAE